MRRWKLGMGVERHLLERLAAHAHGLTAHGLAANGLAGHGLAAHGLTAHGLAAGRRRTRIDDSKLACE